MLIVSCFLVSCETDLIDKKKSIFETKEKTKTAFDEWIYQHYTKGYNIDFKYRFEDIESSHTYNLVPAELDKSIVLTQIVKKVWLETYDEVIDVHFTRRYVPKTIHLVGSAAYNENGSMTLGTAEGGQKVTLYYVNRLDVENIDMKSLNEWYFHTMHHEFAHILHQKVNYDPSFQKISEEDYVGNNWIYKANDTVGVRSKGFISAYSMMNKNEDFVELYAYYVTNTEEWWNEAVNKGSEEGKAVINKKLDIVKDYFKTTWNADMDSIRDVVLRRSEEVKSMEFLTFK